MYRVSEIQSSFAIGNRQLYGWAILKDEMLQTKHMFQDGHDFGVLQTVVAAHEPLEFKQDGLCYHQRMPRFQ